VSLQTAVVVDASGDISLKSTVPGALLPSPGTAAIAVFNPGANPKVSNSLPVQIITPPQPTITSISPPALPAGRDAQVQLIGTGFTPISVVHFRGLNLTVSSVSDRTITVAIPASALLLPGVDPLTVSNEDLVSSPVSMTTYVPIVNNSMVYDSANGLFYLSVPSAAGLPYANSIVSIDPATGGLGKPIPIGSEPNRMAITADGKYLWVALDGGSAVRRVDLTTGVADPQSSVASNGLGSAIISALAALPGAPASVVVSAYAIGDPYSGVSLTIYDNGVPRPTDISSATYSYEPVAWVLLVDPSRNEIYGPGGPDNYTYKTYAFSDSLITLKSSNPSNLTYAQSNTDEAQIVGGKLYTDYAQVIDPESGAQLGSFDLLGNAYVLGSVAIDTSLAKIFYLYADANDVIRVQPISLTDLTPTADPAIVVALPQPDYQHESTGSNRLTRWGVNGLAFRTATGFVSLRSNSVRDLSSTNADLSVSLTATPAAVTGTNTTYTAIVTNHGPSKASDVTVTASLPSTGVLVSETISAGTCSGTTAVLCHLGSLAASSSTTITFQFLQSTAGTGSLGMNVTASEPDPVTSNNQATLTLNVSGDAYNLAPTITAISPTTVASGSAGTTITVTGTGFSNTSTVLLNGSAIPTTYTSTTQLSADVPAASIASLGWAAISVSNPAPGGGASSALPLSVYSVLNLGANHIVYDQYSRRIMASTGPGTSTIPANSLVAITPETGAVSTAIASFGGTPTTLALSSDGQILYTLVPSIASVARFNMITGKPDFTVGNFQAATLDYGTLQSSQDRRTPSPWT
jgi:uncharacterized repeat protein (TIGR01451 family)